MFNCFCVALSEEMFPRLGQMIVDYDPPVKKLSEEFIPHAKVPVIYLPIYCSRQGTNDDSVCVYVVQATYNSC